MRADRRDEPIAIRIMDEVNRRLVLSDICYPKKIYLSKKSWDSIMGSEEKFIEFHAARIDYELDESMIEDYRFIEV